MDSFKALLAKVFGKSNPLTSLSFWAVVLLSGAPAALAQYFGIHLDASAILSLFDPDLSAGDRFVAILAILGIRRRIR